VNNYQHALHVLNKVKSEYGINEILLSYSGGKESLVILDLCSKVFSKIVCFHYYFLPDLKIDQKKYEFAKRRYNVEVLSYQSPDALNFIKKGVFCFPRENKIKIRQLKLKDIYEKARKDSGLNWVVIGWRQTDSLQRLLTLRNYVDESICEASCKIYPLSRWKKKETINYMKINKIPLPSLISKRAQSAGISLDVETLLYLKKFYLSDYNRIIEVFPLAELQIRRAEYYGIKETF